MPKVLRFLVEDMFGYMVTIVVTVGSWENYNAEFHFHPDLVFIVD
jgi:hypothetical protein